MYEVQINVNQKGLQTKKQAAHSRCIEKIWYRETVVHLMIRCRSRHGKYSLVFLFRIQWDFYPSSDTFINGFLFHSASHSRQNQSMANWGTYGGIDWLQDFHITSSRHNVESIKYAHTVNVSIHNPSTRYNNQ